MIKYKLKQLQADVPASIVVFLVALPLCLGIALGSKAPLFSGIIAGVVGGLVIGILSGSPLSVSGPAAGLTAIVAAAILKLPTYETFLLAVVIAGAIQLLLGFAKAGILGDYIPNAVIKGMLAAIGIILILKQIPHLVGYDKDFVGDEAFNQADQENTFSEIIRATGFLSSGATLIGLLSILLLVLFEQKIIKQHAILKHIPSPLAVVFLGTGMNFLFMNFFPGMAVKAEHMVSLPVTSGWGEFKSLFNAPDFSSIRLPEMWNVAITLAIVASLESLLSIEAIDKLDPYRRVTPTNRELKAQGIGNMVSGMLGGLPVTSVIVRSSANVNAGASSKMSAILHGVLLLICVYSIPVWLNLIPLASLAAILIFTGYKLAKLPLFVEFYQKGKAQFIPFLVTIIAILMSDLLIGIMIGIGISLIFIVISNTRSNIVTINDGNRYLIKLRRDINFLNKPMLKQTLESIPTGSQLVIDTTNAGYIDKDIIDVVNEFKMHAGIKEISIEIKKNSHNKLQKDL